METLQVKDDRMVWEQAARDKNGKIIKKQEVLLLPGKARRAADEYVAFVKRSGADLQGSVLSEIEANTVRINSLLSDVRRARSRDEVQTLSQWLNDAVELSKNLDSAYRTVSIPVEGAIHVRSEDGEIYTVMFAGYSGPGGALRTRSFIGRKALVDFLKCELHIDEPAIQSACANLDTNKVAAIPNVILTYYDLVHLDLV